VTNAKNIVGSGSKLIARSLEIEIVRVESRYCHSLPCQIRTYYSELRRCGVSPEWNQAVIFFRSGVDLGSVGDLISTGLLDSIFNIFKDAGKFCPWLPVQPASPASPRHSPPGRVKLKITVLERPASHLRWYPLVSLDCNINFLFTAIMFALPH
jgi:hypothetical protein